MNYIILLYSLVIISPFFSVCPQESDWILLNVPQLPQISIQTATIPPNQSNFLRFLVGQIEAFTWSASGQIITDSLASTFPTCVVYIMDTPRNHSPVTFMSSMLYACSIMYKTKLPFVLAFNKVDVISHDYALTWMEDHDEFLKALKKDKSYMSTLTRSMSLVLDEFYCTLECCGLSAITGEGVPDFFDRLGKAKAEYFENYLPFLKGKIEERQKKEEEKTAMQLEKLAQDSKASGSPKRGGHSAASPTREKSKFLQERGAQGKKVTLKPGAEDALVSGDIKERLAEVGTGMGVQEQAGKAMEDISDEESDRAGPSGAGMKVVRTSSDPPMQKKKKLVMTDQEKKEKKKKKKKKKGKVSKKKKSSKKE